MLTAEQIKKFQALYEHRFGTAISEGEALEMGLKLISLVKLAANSQATTHKERNERTNHDNLNQKAQFKPFDVQDLIDVLGLTIKKDEANKVVTFLCQLSAYSENAQFNVSYNTPPSTGKSYIPTEIASLFPREDVIELAYCSPTAFFHDVGKYDKTLNGYRIDLSRKILIFLDQPHNDLLARLRPLLSHDRKEIMLKITDKSQKAGLRTVKRKRSGDKSVSRSSIYNIFTNIFYAGIIEYHDKQYPGKFPAMVTLEEFDRVQFLLGKKGKPRPQKRRFAFTGMIRCGECGCFITAEIKCKRLRTTGEVREYTYYHCTLRKPQVNCSQRQVVREDDLERQISDELKQLTILPEFKDWALEVLREQNQNEVKDRTAIYESQQRALTQAQGKLDRLVDMRLNDLLSNAEYVQKKAQLKKEIQDLRKQTQETEDRIDNWLELTEKVFDFATHAHIAFMNGDLETRKQILMALGSNPTMKDGKLALEASPWLIPIKNDYEGLRQEFLRLEPADRPENKKRMAHLRTIRSNMLRLLDEFRTSCVEMVA